MLLKAAFLVLAVWLVGVFAADDAGSLVHILLLVGLLMLLLGALNAPDAAAREGAGPPPDTR